MVVVRVLSSHNKFFIRFFAFTLLSALQAASFASDYAFAMNVFFSFSTIGIMAFKIFYHSSSAESLGSVDSN